MLLRICLICFRVTNCIAGSTWRTEKKLSDCFFVGNQGNEGWDDCGGYCIDAYDKTGTRYCITYDKPALKQRKNECDADYADRCADAINLETPYLIECFDTDYWTPVLLYDSSEPHDGIHISEFVEQRW